MTDRPATSPQTQSPTPSQQTVSDNQTVQPQAAQPAPADTTAFNVPPQILAQILNNAGNAQAGFPFIGQAIPQIPLIVQNQQMARIWQGPYPPPDAVDHYEKTLPGSFNRIIAMVENLQQAQISEAKQNRDYAQADIRRGQLLGFAATFSAMAGAILCLRFDYPWVAGAFLGVPVMSVAKALIDSAKKDKPSDIIKAAAQQSEVSQQNK